MFQHYLGQWSTICYVFHKVFFNQQFLVRPNGSFENSISPSYVDETHYRRWAWFNDKFMDINFFDGHGPDFMRPRHSPIRRWFWVSTPSICWFQMMWFVASRLRLYLGMGLSWLVWTWVTLNCNAFSLFISSKFSLVDKPIFWQTHSPVGIPFPPHLLSRQSRWGRQDVGRLCSGAIHHRGSLPSPMKNRNFSIGIFTSPCQVDTTPQQMTSRFWVSGTRAARQDKLHQEFYNVPTKEVDLAGWGQFSIGILGISGWPGWLRIIWIGFQIWGFSLNIP